MTKNVIWACHWRQNYKKPARFMFRVREGRQVTKWAAGAVKHLWQISWAKKLAAKRMGVVRRWGCFDEEAVSAHSARRQANNKFTYFGNLNLTRSARNRSGTTPIVELSCQESELYHQFGSDSHDSVLWFHRLRAEPAAPLVWIMFYQTKNLWFSI